MNQSESEIESRPDPVLERKPGFGQGQFGIAALFWTTFVFGLGLAYLQRLDSPDIVIDALFAVALGVVVGGLIGMATGKLRDALFWSTLVAAFGYISTASDPIYIPPHRLAWAAVGAFTGGFAPTIFPDRKIINALVCAVAAGATMGCYAWVSKSFPASADVRLDVYAAPVIGIAVAAFVRIILWMESRQAMPRYVTATWLMAAVVLGNYFSN